MNIINKLNNTCELLNKLDDLIIRNTGKDFMKNQLLSLSEELATYKDLEVKDINFKKDEIISKITDVLNRINEIEIMVKNKLIITEKYNSYLNS